MGDREHGAGAFIEGIFLGAVIGGVLGVLFAPQSGDKTRKWLKDVKEENQDIIDDALNNGENLINTAKQSIEDKISKLSKLLESKTDEKTKKTK